MSVPVPSKKGGLEGLATILSALGGARTPVGQALVQAGIFVGIVFGVVWASEHGGEAAKSIAGWLAVPGAFLGFLLFIRVFSAVVREVKDDLAGPRKPEGPG